ncbi:MAG: hypothetical protein WD360_01650 [Nitriliruptoraceae bacterium]
MTDVDIHIDPICPYCWATAKWLRQVQVLRNLTVGWRFISLRFVNEERGYGPNNDDFRLAHKQGTRLLRVLAATRAEHGNDTVGKLYHTMGNVVWESEPPAGIDRSAIRRVHGEGFDIAAMLTQTGLDPALAAAADDDRFDAIIQQETKRARDRAGHDVGTPVMVFNPPDGPGFFGPVISENFSDEDALAVYDAVTALSGIAGFSELKRSIRRTPDVRFLANIRAND